MALTVVTTIGCGGEANYSFADVQRFSHNFFDSDMIFTSRDKVYVATVDSDVLQLQTNSTDNLTFSIVGGEDSVLFSVDKITGKLSFIDKPVFQSGGDNEYEVVVATEDSNGNRAVQVVVVEVVEDITKIPPVVYTTLKTYEVSSFSGLVFTLDADAADGQGALNFSLSGEDKSYFTIDENGNVRFEQTVAESSGKSTFSIDINVTDGYGNVSSFSDVTVVKVASSSEIRPVIISHYFKIVENSLGNALLNVYKADDAEITTYTVSGGDAAIFEVSAEGRLRLKESQDFESLNRSFTFTMQIEDSHGQKSEPVTMTVEIIDMDEKFHFNGIHDLVVKEGRTGELTTVTATANTLVDGVEKQFSLSQGSDAFTIGSNGTIRFKNAAQLDANMTLQVTVASQLNGSLTSSEPFQVLVVDDPDKIPPSIDNNYLRSVTIVETQSVVLSIQATPNGSATTLSYRLIGTDSDKFTIDTNGDVSLNTAFNENLSNLYAFSVEITDDNGNVVTTDTISVTLLQDPAKIRPVIDSTTFNIMENSTANMNVLITSEGIGIVDTYSVTGADAALFTFDENGLRFNNGADFESHASNAGTNSYSVTLQVEDSLGNVSDAKNIVAIVTDVDETLQFTSLSSFLPVEETTEVGVIHANGKDETPVTITYTLLDNTQDFVLDAASGELALKSPGEFGRHYKLTIQAESQFNGSQTETTVIVEIIEKNYAITFIPQGTPTLDQYMVVEVPIEATSAAGETLTYAMAAGTDTSIFKINATTGLMTITVPAYKYLTDPEANIYRGAVVASDAYNNSATQQGEFHVKVVPGEPIFDTDENLSIDENQKVVAQLQAHSPIGSSLEFEKVLGADGYYFSVSADGILTFDYAKNFEYAEDANGDNIYEVDIRVTDTLHSVNTVVERFLVHVNDVSDGPTNIVFDATGTVSASVSDGSLFFDNTTNLYLNATASPSNGALYSSIVSNPKSSIFSMNSNGILRVDAPRVSDDITYEIVIDVREDKGETTRVTMYVTIEA